MTHWTEEQLAAYQQRARAGFRSDFADSSSGTDRPGPPARMKEADVTRQIRDVLRSCRYPNWKIFQTLGSYRGMSDILAVQPATGRCIVIEVKTPGWTPPGPEAKAWKHYSEQKAFIDMVVASGGIGFFAASVEDVIRELDLGARLAPLFNLRTSCTP